MTCIDEFINNLTDTIDSSSNFANNKSTNQFQNVWGIASYSSAYCVLVFSLLANLGLIVGLKKTNKKLTLSQKLYIYLSITDGILALILLYYAMIEILSLSTCTSASIGSAVSVYALVASFGTFTMISYLRNLAIRKPFYTAPKHTVYFALAFWNLIVALMGINAFFAYEPIYSSQTLYSTHWLYTGLVIALFFTSATIFNIWSKRILDRQSHISTSEIELHQQKRNEKAVKILNIILLIYAVCMLPLSIYLVVLGSVMFDFKGKANTLSSVYGIFSYMYQPVFPCSGLNALAYMMKDKRIRKFYRRLLCCSRGE